MGRGLLIWLLVGMLGALVYEAGVGEQDARERTAEAPSDVHVMDGGDGVPPPPSYP
jgi:hypothetical protein